MNDHDFQDEICKQCKISQHIATDAIDIPPMYNYNGGKQLHGWHAARHARYRTSISKKHFCLGGMAASE